MDKSCKIPAPKAVAAMIAMALAFSVSASAWGMPSEAFDSANVIQQASDLPDDFADYFFDSPQTVALMVNGIKAGLVRISIHKDNSVEVIDSVGGAENDLDPAKRAQWIALLSKPHTLGACHSECGDGLRYILYSLETSTLSITTSDASTPDERYAFIDLSHARRGGALLQHRLSVFRSSTGGEGGSYQASLYADVGNWSAKAEGQVYRSYGDSRILGGLTSAYMQREYRGGFLRLGYFMPSDQNAVTTSSSMGADDVATLGFMLGSSNALSNQAQSSSLYPLEITSEGDGMVEIYRNGVLLDSQPVHTGLQDLSTANLPGGIYPVELRLITDGKVVRTQSSTVYKPRYWDAGFKRWRYMVYAGRAKSIGNMDDLAPQMRDGVSAGAVLNYLVTPSLLLGAGLTKIANEYGSNVSVQWFTSPSSSVAVTAYHDNESNRGLAAQAIFSVGPGSVVLSHDRVWQPNVSPDYFPTGETIPYGQTVRPSGGAWSERTALGWSQQSSWAGSVLLQASYMHGSDQGLAIDLSSFRQFLVGDSNWTVSATIYRHPVNLGSSHGQDLGASLALEIPLGNPDASMSASLASSRSAGEGSPQFYESVGAQRTTSDGSIRNLSAYLTHGDDGSSSLSASVGVTSDSVLADGYVSEASGEAGGWSAGLTLQSATILGEGSVAEIARSGGGVDTGAIIDVQSELSGREITVRDSRGGTYTLHPGRNFIPLRPYAPGRLQIDVGESSKAIAATPSSFDYQAMRGAMLHMHVDVRKVVTLLGRMVDPHGKILGGLRVTSGVGESVTEHDGYFVIDVPRSAPVVTAEGGGMQCSARIQPSAITGAKRDVVMVGDVQCVP